MSFVDNNQNAYLINPQKSLQENQQALHKKIHKKPHKANNPLPPVKKRGSLLGALLFGLFGATMVAAPSIATASNLNSNWVSSWSASPQPLWADEFVLPINTPRDFENQTVIQTATVSLGGDAIRLKLSNAYGSTSMTVDETTVALAPNIKSSKTPIRKTVQKAVQESSATATLPSTLPVTFQGQKRVRIPAGAVVLSDPIALPIDDGGRLAVSLYFAEHTPLTTFHWDARETAWILPNRHTSQNSVLQPDAGSDADNDADDLHADLNIVSTTTRPLLTGIEVRTQTPAHSVVVIGDSVTDGATATLDNTSRWTDFLARRLAPHDVAVVNAGISGNRLLSSGMGESVLARLDRDVFTQTGVASVIVLIGINDIAWPQTAFAPKETMPSLQEMISGYEQLAAQAHAQGVSVIVATLPPFKGALPDTPLDNYYQPEKDALRLALNQWIRSSDAFDGVIDLDNALRNSIDPSSLQRQYDSGDHLHPSDVGNQAMAEAVDLNLLLQPKIRSGIAQ